MQKCPKNKCYLGQLNSTIKHAVVMSTQHMSNLTVIHTKKNSKIVVTKNVRFSEKTVPSKQRRQQLTL